ncbi:MAG: DUF4400 domain-containing protein [Burkholderiales bacterium]|nr:DUF4400 domain-containing protein [Burkholderiales bacterium]
MKERLSIILTLTFIFCFMWFPLEFTQEHWLKLAQQENEEATNHLHGLYDWTIESAEKFESLVDIPLFPEKVREDDVERTAVAEVGRIFDIPYFKSLKAMISNAILRMFFALTWLLLCLPIYAVVVQDGMIQRKLRYESFAAPHPILFQTALLIPAFLGFTLAMTLIAPFTVGSWLGFFDLLFLGLGLHLLVSNFHKYS